ncbi:MAG: DUF814 domain-containing protein [Chloroflexi bacterium]|nr:DUF814 domain-containing protein [Chloroflexota bacterium]
MPVESISAAVERFFAGGAEARIGGVEPLKRRVRELLADRVARVRARIDALERSLAQAAEADRLRTWGELVLGFAYEIRPGQTELAVEDLRIPLDPAKSAVENAQAYFREYHKAKGAAAEVPQRLVAARLDAAYLDEVGTQIDLAERREELAAVERELAPAPAASPASAKRRGPRLPLRTLRTSDGFEILVGTTSVQNDEITFKLARPDDLWLHARGVPGAHVVVRTGGRQLPAASLQAAAALAARHSQARQAGQVAVDYTQRRYVRRIPNAPPGLVTYTHEQTIHVSPSV